MNDGLGYSLRGFFYGAHIYTRVVVEEELGAKARKCVDIQVHLYILPDVHVLY